MMKFVIVVRPSACCAENEIHGEGEAGERSRPQGGWIEPVRRARLGRSPLKRRPQHEGGHREQHAPEGGGGRRNLGQPHQHRRCATTVEPTNSRAKSRSRRARGIAGTGGRAELLATGVDTELLPRNEALNDGRFVSRYRTISTSVNTMEAMINLIF